MPTYHVEIFWEPSTQVIVEAENKEEAEEIAIQEAGQPEVSECNTEKQE